MTAFELYEAAFARACDDQQPTAHYVQEYASGAWNTHVADDVAERIAQAKRDVDAANADGNWSLNFDHIVRRPLQEIEI